MDTQEPARTKIKNPTSARIFLGKAGAETTVALFWDARDGTEVKETFRGDSTTVDSLIESLVVNPELFKTGMAINGFDNARIDILCHRTVKDAQEAHGINAPKEEPDEKTPAKRPAGKAAFLKAEERAEKEEETSAPENGATENGARCKLLFRFGIENFTPDTFKRIEYVLNQHFGGYFRAHGIGGWMGENSAESEGSAQYVVTYVPGDAPRWSDLRQKIAWAVVNTGETWAHVEHTDERGQITARHFRIPDFA